MHHDDLLAVVDLARDWQNHDRECEAIMAAEASRPHVAAMCKTLTLM